MKFQYTLALISALALTCTATPVEGDAASPGINEITANADKLTAQYKKLREETHSNVVSLTKVAELIQLSIGALTSKRNTIAKQLEDTKAKQNEYANHHKDFTLSSKELKQKYEKFILDLKSRKEKTADKNEADSKKLALEQEQADKEALRVRQKNEELKRAVASSEADS